MPKRLYVGNLTDKVTENDLRPLFEKYGQVHSIEIKRDEETSEPRGFAFVEMDAENANDARKGLDGLEFKGMRLKVNKARMRRGPDITGGRPRGRKKHSW
ncbi:MAG: RNA-binding protein [Calditrichaeota bacterium]|nr:RNA-binding protein [Calditrichota bacterium]